MKSENHRFNPWPYGIIAAFAVFISGIAAMIVAASADRVDLVAKDYYEQEIRYQARVDQLQRTEPFADQIGVAFDGVTRQVRIQLPREHASAGATGRIEFYRPAQATDDHSHGIVVDGEGRQALSGAELAAGLWKVRLGWSVGGLEYFADRELVVSAREEPAKL
ncbi:MAG: FixH family protein [Verrucomicrobiales bacterium]|nr:FixH family protein [Verrucomicrobiales bacterium]